MTADAPSRRWKLGPGLLVTAAFIGPGTVTTATRAGSQFGFALLWALLFSMVATIVLQEMAARLGLVARRGLAAAIRESVASPGLRCGALALVLTAIVLGNMAYQTGNLLGAGLGLNLLCGVSPNVGAGIVGVVIAGVLAAGGLSRPLHAVLTSIVLAMSAAFLATAVIARPDPAELVRGLTKVSLPADSLLTVIALVGTTVVPYNLFLHATTVQQRWPAGGPLAADLRAARLDTVLAVSMGGLVTMAIVVTAATALHGHSTTGVTIERVAGQLGPGLGTMGKWLFAVGFAAAGVTSAITAPLAAGYAMAGAFPQSSQRGEKLTMLAVVLIGTVLACTFGQSPQVTIVIAQAANGLLLPLVAFFLLLVMNRRDLLGDHRNGWALNLAGAAVVGVTLVLGYKNLWSLVR